MFHIVWLGTHLKAPDCHWAPLSLASVSWLAQLTEDFGQREHLFIIYALPWLLLRFCSWEGKQFHPVGAFILGVLAGMAASIKPQFIMPIVLIEAYWLLRYRCFRPLFALEVRGFVCFGLCYAGFLLLNPGVLAGMMDSIELALTHRLHIDTQALEKNIFRMRFQVPLLLGAISLGCSLLGTSKYFRLLGGLASLALMGAVVVAIHGGGYGYRHLILYVGGIYCAGLLILLPLAPHQQLAHRPFLSGLVWFVLVGSIVFVNTYANRRELARHKIPTPRDLREVVGGITESGDSVLVMSVAMGYSLPWLSVTDLKWANSMMDSWYLPLDENNEKAKQILDHYAEVVLMDIEKFPSVIVVNRGYKERVPRFLERYELIDKVRNHYTLAGQTGSFDVYSHIGFAPVQETGFLVGEHFELYSWEISFPDQACDTMEIRTWWRPGMASDVNEFMLHVDIVGERDGRPILETFDRIGEASDYAAWNSITDVQRLEIPCESESGSYVLLLSMEDMSVEGGLLLPVLDSHGANYGNYIFLGSFDLVDSSSR